MISNLVTLTIPCVVLLASHAEADSILSYTCPFVGGRVVIKLREPSGRATVEIGSDVEQYIFDKQKLVAIDSKLPTYFFQSELKRWKRLNAAGETLETTVCTTFASR